MRTPPVILSIAGFDPSSGAGVTADIKTIAAEGCFGTACVTALTVQSTQGVRHVQPLPASLVRDTLLELASDFTLAAVRIGMLGCGEIAEVVADFLAQNRISAVVLDPVIRSSSGADLLGPGGLQVLRERLLPLSTITTPNLDEAAVLAGFPVNSQAEMFKAARCLVCLGVPNVVVTGGHLPEPVDVLVGREGEQAFEGSHIESRATHGTGCAFATSLACRLSLGDTVSEAVLAAKRFVAQAMQHAYPVGKGIGPLNHLYRLR